MKADTQQHFAITSRFSGRVLFEGEFGSLKLCVEAAVSADANLADAYLVGANLADANLARAYLAGADLAGADLADANLADANLARADLVGADLARADLAGADLADANLAGANLARAVLAGAKGIRPAQLAQFSILPAGTLIGWKKLQGNIIAQVEIPADAARVNAYSSRKCRAEYVKTLALFDGETPLPFDAVGIGQHDGETRYVVGEITKPDRFEPNPQEECSHGIHFWITRAEAEAY